MGACLSKCGGDDTPQLSPAPFSPPGLSYIDDMETLKKHAEVVAQVLNFALSNFPIPGGIPHKVPAPARPAERALNSGRLH